MEPRLSRATFSDLVEAYAARGRGVSPADRQAAHEEISRRFTVLRSLSDSDASGLVAEVLFGARATEGVMQAHG